MRPRLEILPAPQLALWPELSQIPDSFVLYGGTAIALRLGGRESLDFDFFTSRPVSSDLLARTLPVLRRAELIQVAPNTATFSIHRQGQVKLSFFGGLSFGRVGRPNRCDDNGLQIASLLDLAAQKMKVILARAEPKDYLDIRTLLEGGVTLTAALGAAKMLYPQFNPVLSLKALAYFGEPALAVLPSEVRKFLTAQAAKVDSIQTPALASPEISAAEDPG
jgi:hypothetical protein